MTPYDSWSIEALRGYVVMMGEFLAGNMHEEPTRETYVNRLEQAKATLATREAALAEEAAKKAQASFREGTEAPTTESKTT